MNLDLPLNVILLVAGALLTVLFGWLGARPLDVRKGPRMVPWRFLMLLSATFTVLMAAALLQHFGLMPDSQVHYRNLQQP